MGLEVAIPRAIVAPAARRRWRVPLSAADPADRAPHRLAAVDHASGLVEAYQLTPPLQVLQSAVEQWNRGVLQKRHPGDDTGARAGRFPHRLRPRALLLGTAVGLLRGVDRRAVDPTLQAVRSPSHVGMGAAAVAAARHRRAAQSDAGGHWRFFPLVCQPRRWRVRGRPQADRGRARVPVFPGWHRAPDRCPG